ncbi:MAG: hypothetical protein ACTH11_14670, partial [Brachybacterium alimentarium]
MVGDDTTEPATPPSRRWTLLLVLAAAVVVAVLVAVWIVATRPPATVAASWTETADDPGDASDALRSCQQPDSTAALDIHITEQRGIASLLVGTKGDGSTLTCLAVEVDEGWNSISMVSDVDEEAPAVPDDGVLTRANGLAGMEPVAEDAAIGAETAGSDAPADTSEPSSQHVLAGEVGEAVVGLRLQTSAGPVEATLGGGWFGAWWPTANDSELNEPVTAQVTLEDGTTRT